MSSTKKRGKSAGWIFKTLFLLAVAGTILVTLAGALVWWQFSRDLPKIMSVADYRPLGVTRVFGANGREDQLMAEFYKERRYLIPYDKMPEHVVRAFIAAEDDRFFEHQGVNLAAIVRAAIANFKAGHTVQGGSTITQQVTKSLLLTSEKTFVRKIKELILANRIEKNLSKQQILYLYLNQIYLGHGAYGVQAASRTYFRKDVSDISIAEAAMIAGMPTAPGKFSPHLNPKKAKERQLYVLRRMYENKYISQTQMAESAAQPLKIHDNEDLSAKYGPYLVEHVRRYILDKYGEKAIYEDGLTVAVPTSKELSAHARESLREGLRTVDKRMGYRGPLKQLKSGDEIEKHMRDQRVKLIQTKLQYAMLLPDGRLDALESLKAAGIHSDSELLKEGEIHEAVVTSVDDRRKVAGVMIGAVKTELPLERMKWARRARDEKNPTPGPEPKNVSSVLGKGDVILVRTVKTGEGGIIVALEQDPAVQGAVFSIETQTGYVLAMEGGYDFEKSEFNRATQAMRQPGSAFKPIIYAAGLEKGFTPASIIVDSPLVYDDAETGKWKPSNFEEKFYGDTTYRHALIKSRNIPTIKILQAVQIPKLLEYTKRLGMQGNFPADLSVSLGSGSMSLMEMTRVYALFPRLGRQVHPIFVTSVKDRDGKLLEEQKPSPPATIDQIASMISVNNAAANAANPEPVVEDDEPSASPSARPRYVLPSYPTERDPDQVLDPRVAYVMTHLMKEVVTYGTGAEAKQLGRPAAGKTGTTSDYIDAWFMGFTPTVTTGSWVGFDNLKPIGPNETGAKAALPVWLGFMKEAVKAYPEGDFQIPPGIVFATIDPNTGKLAAPNSSRAIKEAFIEGTEPTHAASSAETTRDSESDFLKEDSE